MQTFLHFNFSKWPNNTTLGILNMVRNINGSSELNKSCLEMYGISDVVNRI